MLCGRTLRSKWRGINLIKMDFGQTEKQLHRQGPVENLETWRTSKPIWWKSWWRVLSLEGNWLNVFQLHQRQGENKAFQRKLIWLECPSTDEWIKMWYIITMKYYSAIKKNKIMPFAATWLQLEIIILSEVSQNEKDKDRMISLIRGI